MRLTTLLVCAATALICWAGDFGPHQPSYKVLPAVTQNNLSIFPVIADKSFDTGMFLTLDEGIRSGQVTVSELKESNGLVRPRSADPGFSHPYPAPWWPPFFPSTGARVNTLALTNSSDRPLILLAGEIVTGGKQDRVVGKDRIVPPNSDPINLDVFCVEPHRWIGVSSELKSTSPSMAQPSLRATALVEQNQQQVWNEVAKSRAAFAGILSPTQAEALQDSSSYAKALQNRALREALDSITAPIERSFGSLHQQLRSQEAVGAVVALNGEIIWADVFASPELFDRYWPKLIRSYAAESLGPHVEPTVLNGPASQANAQEFVTRLYGDHESIDSQPNVYSSTEVQGAGFKVFLLTALLPNTNFTVHLANMQQVRNAAE